MIDENGTLSLFGTILDPDTQDTYRALIDWGDGEVTSADVDQVNRTFTASHTYLDDNPSGTSSDPYTIQAFLTDDDGGSATATATVTVNNVAPEILALSNSAAAPGAAYPGDPVTVSGTFSDPGQDSHQVVMDWGDGVVQAFALAAGARDFAFDHAYATAGTRAISVTVGDDDGGSDSDSTQAVVVIPPPIRLVNGILRITGNDQDNFVWIQEFAAQGVIKVFTNVAGVLAIHTFASADVKSLDVDLGGGLDALLIVGTENSDIFTLANGTVTVNGRVINYRNVEFLLTAGGLGNDRITVASADPSVRFLALLGEAGNDVLTGGSGSDILVGGSGNDILIGGPGNDQVDGGPGNDLILNDAYERLFMALNVITLVQNQGINPFLIWQPS